MHFLQQIPDPRGRQGQRRSLSRLSPQKGVHNSGTFGLERGLSPGGSKVKARKRFGAEQIIPKLREAEV